MSLEKVNKQLLPLRQKVLAPWLGGIPDQLHLTLYPLTVGGGKRILPQGLHRKFRLLSAKPYPTGVVGLQYARQES